MWKFLIHSAILLSLSTCHRENNPLDRIIEEDHSLSSIASDPQYEVQIIYTQIDRDSLNNPAFTTYTYQLDTSRYFYPASTVKLPVVLLSMERMHQLNIPGLDIYTTMLTDSVYSGQSTAYTDSTAQDLLPSAAQYIRKILVTSDNDAFNRLYEFLGQDYINAALADKGYDGTRISHRLSIALSKDQNAHTNPIRFVKGDSVIYAQDGIFSHGTYSSPSPVLKGKGYVSGDAVIDAPFDFSAKNAFPLTGQHQMIAALFFPEQFPDYTFDLTEADRDFLYHYMSVTPRASGIDVYEDESHYWDAYAKFIIYGASQNVKIPDHVRIYNKIGQAYGYCIDNAYIADTLAGVEFMLSAVISTNQNQIYNDGQYEYESIGLPFLARLGAGVYNYELSRQKKYKPDFKFLE